MKRNIRALLTIGVVMIMTLGLTSAAFAQEIVEQEAPTGEEVPAVSDTRPVVDQELPPAPEEPEGPVVLREEPIGVEAPAGEEVPAEESLIAPVPGAETDSGLSGWDWIGIVAAVAGALVVGVGVGWLFTRQHYTHHPLAH